MRWRDFCGKNYCLMVDRAATQQPDSSGRPGGKYGDKKGFILTYFGRYNLGFLRNTKKLTYNEFIRWFHEFSLKLREYILEKLVMQTSLLFVCIPNFKTNFLIKLIKS